MLAVGGRNNFSDNDPKKAASYAEYYDPKAGATGAWFEAFSLRAARIENISATLLPE